MRTLQEQYNAIKIGNGNKAQFLKQARHLFPQYINQYSDFDTAASVLKSKQIISEAAGGVVAKGFSIYDWKKILGEEVKATEKETSKQVLDTQAHAYDNKDMKNADNVNFNEIMKGFYAELKDEKNKEKSGDEIKAMVVKNLAKDPLYYTKNGEFGTKGVGYTTEAPGLGEPKEPKGKHKSSGYGDLDTKVEKVKANVQDSLGDKEAKTSMPSKVKEMEVTPKSASGVKRMPMPGSEKTMKLQEGYDSKAGLGKKEQDKISNLSKEEKKALHNDLTDAVADINDKDFKDKASYAKAMKDAKTKVYKKYNILEENTDILDQYADMSDSEIIQWAEEDGMEDFIVLDGEGGLANREEVLRALLGTEDLGYEESEEEMWGPDDIDPAGGYGPSSHMESTAEQKLRSLIRNIIKEELNRSDYMQALYALEKPHLSDKDAIQDIVSIYNSHIQQLSSLQGNLEEGSENTINEASLSAEDLEFFSKDIYADKDKNKIYISPKLAKSLGSSFFSRGPSSYERTRSDSDQSKSAYLKMDSNFRSLLRKGLTGANVTQLPVKNSMGDYKWVALNLSEKDYDISISPDKVTINKKQLQEGKTI